LYGIASEKKLSSKNGVVTKFMANCLCSIRKKTFTQKMELSQNLWQPFACVASKPFLKKWSCHKIYGKLLLV
jgi:hypothetical protein